MCIMAVLENFLLLILFVIQQSLAGEWCTDYNNSEDSKPDKFYCETSCCGNKMNRYCCWGLTPGAIVWLVIGCLVGLSIIVGTIIAIYCCCRRQPGDQGHVMGPDNCMPVATTATAMAFAGPEGAIGASISQGGPYRISATQAMAMSDSNPPAYPGPPSMYPGAYELQISKQLQQSY